MNNTTKDSVFKSNKTEKGKMKDKILFVCAGNTCRSPMAEFILKQKRPDLQVSSAGLYATEGTAMSPHSFHILLEKGISKEELLEFSSKPLTQTELSEDNIIYVMDDYIKRVINKMGRMEDVYLLGDDGISDPFGGTFEDYQTIKKQIEKEIDNIF